MRRDIYFVSQKGSKDNSYALKLREGFEIGKEILFATSNAIHSTFYRRAKIVE